MPDGLYMAVHKPVSRDRLFVTESLMRRNPLLSRTPGLVGVAKTVRWTDISPARNTLVAAAPAISPHTYP